LRVSSPLFALRAGRGSKDLNATVRWTVAADGSTEANLYFAPAEQNVNESLPVYAAHRAATIPQSAGSADSSLYTRESLRGVKFLDIPYSLPKSYKTNRTIFPA